MQKRKGHGHPIHSLVVLYVVYLDHSWFIGSEWYIDILNESNVEYWRNKQHKVDRSILVEFVKINWLLSRRRVTERAAKNILTIILSISARIAPSFYPWNFKDTYNLVKNSLEWTKCCKGFLVCWVEKHSFFELACPLEHYLH